jgi:group I intron endonuclease
MYRRKTVDTAEPVFTIYKHTCIVTGKSYIGQTQNLKDRSWMHTRPYSRCPAFRNAVQKYGWDNFTTEILHEGLSLAQANEYEELAIAAHSTQVPHGYNLSPGGKNHTHHKLTRMKLAARPVRPISKETRAKLIVARARRGPHSEETKKKMSASRTGKRHSMETIEKLRRPKSKYTVNVPIVQLTKDGVEVARYSSLRDASKATGIKYLGNALIGRAATAGGYVWKYL